MLNRLTRWLVRRLHVGRTTESHGSEDDIRQLVEEASGPGVVPPGHSMLNRVLRLGERTAESVMTPRTRIAWLDISASDAENLAVMRETPYSRYPVYRGDEQDVVGILEIKDLIDLLGNPGAHDLMGHLGEPLYIPATTRALDLLGKFREAGMPLALVVDEYGDIEGLVTLNDVLAAVVGTGATALMDHRDYPIVAREDGSWLVDGSVSVEDLRELLGLTELPREDDHDFNTAAGMAVAQFGRIPRPGDSFDWSEFRFEIVDLDGMRVDKLLISRRGNAIATPDYPS